MCGASLQPPRSLKPWLSQDSHPGPLVLEPELPRRGGACHGGVGGIPSCPDTPALHLPAFTPSFFPVPLFSPSRPFPLFRVSFHPCYFSFNCIPKYLKLRLKTTDLTIIVSTGQESGCGFAGHLWLKAACAVVTSGCPRGQGHLGAWPRLKGLLANHSYDYWRP